MCKEFKVGISITPIAYMETDLPEKFGLPRQAGLAPALKGRIVFEPAYRNPDALRGLENYTHLWAIWQFSLDFASAPGGDPSSFQPTVRPPKLGGNTRIGVFASRSPNRPNRLGLSALKIEGIDYECKDGPAILVSGVDMADGTPIIDIKPYLPYADAIAGSAGSLPYTPEKLQVEIPESVEKALPAEKAEALKELLSLDPRPGYQKDAAREYGISFAGMQIKFAISDGICRVIRAEKEALPENE